MSVTGFQRRRRLIAEMRAKAEAEAGSKAETNVEVAEPTNKELMAMLDKLGIEYDKKANKATLKALLEANKDNEGAE